MTTSNQNDNTLSITVEYVNGRFPFRPGPLRSENFTVDVTPLDEHGRVRLRLDSAIDHPDFWMELHLRCNMSAIVASLYSTEIHHDD